MSAFLIFFFIQSIALATQNQIIKNVSADGSCAIVEMTAEQSQLIALQRARALAIEQAVGVEVSSTTIVTNGMVAIDFIKTYSKGFIINEKVEWLPIGQYQKDNSTPPIPEYRVKINTDIYIPQKKIKPIGLDVKLNATIFKSGERAVMIIRGERIAKFAIFNITADDSVQMLFPNDYERENILQDSPFEFPAKNSKITFIMGNLPRHKRDVEAVFVVAMDDSYTRDFNKIFPPLKPMKFSMFFKRYSEIADYCEEVILPYEIVDDREN